MTDNENKYLAFLGFSRHDNRGQRLDTPDVSRRCWGDWLQDALKTFSIPVEFVGQINARGESIPERIHPVFRDDQELSEDAALTVDIRKALEQSICLIVICSPRSAQDLRVNEVVRYFKQLGRGKNILPIVVAGEPNASDGNKSGASPEDECFVPALRHPVQPDGTLDLTRRAGRHIFVDARHGAEKREIVANDHRAAEADLEMAKIHLIALLIGVGFNGLWWREQRRHFHDFAEAQQQVRKALNQVEEARRQTREAQDRILEIQNLPRDVHGQIQAAQNQALEAQNQARAAREQLQEFQDKVRDTQAQLEEARERARAAESKILETQILARDAQNQLEETRKQARAMQDQILETQNPAPAVPGQIQAAQEQEPNAQRQLEETRQQAQAAHSQLLEAQSQVQEFRNQARSAQAQLEEAHNRTRAAESKVLEAQNHVQETQSQLDEVRKHVHEAQNTQRQLEETRKQAQDIHDKFLEAHSQLEKARHQVHEAESKIVEMQAQAHAAQNQLQEMQSQSRNSERDVQSRVKATQNQIQEIQNRSRNARRLTKALAILAVLALLAAGEALRQRQIASQMLAKAVAEAAGNFDLVTGALDQAKIRQMLGDIGGAEQNENRRRSLDQLAASIPRAEIPEALKAASVILNDQQRSHFQKWLLVRLGWVNPVSAMTCAGAVEGKIVNDEGLNDSAIHFQLAVLDNWMKTDLPGAFNWACQLPDADSRSRALEKIIPALVADNPENTLARLNDLQPAPDERIYQLLFQCWAEKDPQTAGQFARQHLGLSGDALGEMTEAWIQSGWSSVLQGIDRLDWPPEIMQPQKAPSPWAKFLLN